MNETYKVQREDPFHLHPLWSAIMDVYVSFSSVCRKYGLRHYVGFGSAIGVLRHGGFIPWDDDMDVMMPRPDYEKFKEVAKLELPGHFKFVDIYNTPEYRQHFAKIMDSRKEVVEAVEKGVGRHLASGVFIDIMPVDGFPTRRSEILKRRIGDKILCYKRMYVDRKNRPDLLKYKIAAAIGAMLSFCYPRLRTDRDFALYYDKRIKRYPFGSTGKCAAVTSSMYLCQTSQVYDESDLADAVMKDLDGLKVPIASGYDAMLRARYGDYMKMPPVEAQKPHHYNQKEAPWKFGPTGKEGK